MKLGRGKTEALETRDGQAWTSICLLVMIFKIPFCFRPVFACLSAVRFADECRPSNFQEHSSSMLKPAAVFSCCLMFFDLMGSLMMFWDVKKWRARRSALQNRFWSFLHEFLSCLTRANAYNNTQQILESSGQCDILFHSIQTPFIWAPFIFLPLCTKCGGSESLTAGYKRKRWVFGCKKNSVWKWHSAIQKASVGTVHASNIHVKMYEKTLEGNTPLVRMRPSSCCRSKSLSNPNCTICS